MIPEMLDQLGLAVGRPVRLREVSTADRAETLLSLH